jgi:hypothetical protein
MVNITVLSQQKNESNEENRKQAEIAHLAQSNIWPQKRTTCYFRLTKYSFLKTDDLPHFYKRAHCPCKLETRHKLSYIFE